MPIHDWRRDEAGLFRSVTFAWVVRLTEHLNGGALPAGHYAMSRTRACLREPALRVCRVDVFESARRRVAVVAVVLPDEKARRRAAVALACEFGDLLTVGVNVSVAGLLPPGPADPGGMHPPVWRALNPKAKAAGLPADRPLTFAAYQGGSPADASLSYAAVGQPIPPVPLFLKGDQFVLLPLEDTYMLTIGRLPSDLRDTPG